MKHNLYRLAFVCSVTLLLTGCKTAQTSKSVNPMEQMSVETYNKAATMYVDASIKRTQGLNDEALAEFLQLLAFASQYPAAHYQVATLYHDKGMYKDALPHAEEALKLDPNNEWYYLLMAEVYERNDRVTDGVKIMEKALKRFPGNQDMMLQLSDLYLKEKQYEKALAIYDKLENHSGMFENVVRQKKEVYKYLNRTDKVIEELERLIAALREDNARYFYELHDIYLSGRDRESAVKTLERLVAQHPDDPIGNFKLIDYYSIMGQPDKANLLLEKSFDNPQVTAEAKVQYVFRLLQSSGGRPENFARVQTFSNRLYRQYPRSAIVLTLCGDIYASTGKLDSARTFYKSSLQYDDLNQKVWEVLLSLDMNLQAQDSLMRDAELALEVYPNNPSFIYYSGLAYYQKKKYDDAGSAFEKYLKFSTTDNKARSEVCALLGDVYYQQSRFKQSDEYFEQAIELDPENWTAMNNYAYFLSLRQANLEKAEAHIRRVLQQFPDNPTYLDTYGWVLYRNGAVQQAREALERAYKAGPKADIADHLGDVLFQLGEVDRAVELWKEARQKGLQNDILDKKISNRKL